MKRLIMFLVAAFVMSSVHTGFTGDIAAGKAKEAVCAACHGKRGLSTHPPWPTIAGQHEQYLLKQLKDFKKGTRKDPLMSAQAALLSDTDIENVAAYFASLSCK